MSTLSHKLTACLFALTVLTLGIISLGPLEQYRSGPQLDPITGELARSVEQHYDDHFPARDLGTNLWAAINYRLFREGRPGVAIGQGDWLFSEEELYPASQDPNLVDTNLDRVLAISNYLQQQGIPMALLVVPSKARIYADKLGEHQPTPEMAGLYERFLQNLDQAGVFAPYLRPSLAKAANQGVNVFLRTDTHWTPSGADIFALHAAEYIRENFDQTSWGEQQYVTTLDKPQLHRGDLLTYIPLEPLFSDLGPAPDLFSVRTTTAMEDSPSSSQALFADNTASVVLVGTSYSANPLWDFPGALRKHLGRDLINVADEGQGPIVPMVEYLQSPDFRNHPPELVIWEFPERYLAQPLESEQTLAWFQRSERLLAKAAGSKTAKYP
ncbi:MAG: alginate O-acetyltransferase [Marinobacter sp.]|nr:alginate O-acetyltransferase [Marinobacter sp.]